MFGLGLWECFGIIALALLIFGPRFLQKFFTSVWRSLTGFGKSFQEASNTIEIPHEEPKALKDGTSST